MLLDGRPLKYRWVIFWTLAIGYLSVHIQRVSTAVVAPELVKTFGLSGTLLGILASTYFYTYAIMQLPMGLIADYFGPRITITISLLINCISTILFGISINTSMAMFARVLIGFSAAGVFVPTMKIFSEWFSLNEFASTAGILMAMGGIGWVLATTPLALLINWLGWRIAFVLIGIILLVITILTWTLVRNRPSELGWSLIPDEVVATPEVGIGLIEGLKRVLSEKYIWPLAIRFFFSYGIVIGFGGLWGGPYLMEIYDLTKTQAGNVLMLMALGIIVGSPLLGWLSDKVLMRRKPIIMGSTFIHCLVWMPLAFWTEKLNLPFLCFLSFVIGVFGSGVSVVALTASKELFPKEVTGTSIGLMNIIPFGGAAIIPPFMGYIMDKFGRIAGAYPVNAYKEAFSFCFILAGIASIGICFMKETLDRSRGEGVYFSEGIHQ